MTKIALCGKLRSGKDSVAEYLGGKYGFKSFKFSQGIWDTLENLWDIRETSENKPRKLLQDVGQGIREFDNDVWINYTLKRIRRFESMENSISTNILITDVRQPNEFARLKAEGYTIIRIVADESLRYHRACENNDEFVIGNMAHETETHIDSFDVDFEVNNDGTLDELFEQVENVLNILAMKNTTQWEGKNEHGNGES